MSPPENFSQKSQITNFKAEKRASQLPVTYIRVPPWTVNAHPLVLLELFLFFVSYHCTHPCRYTFYFIALIIFIAHADRPGKNLHVTDVDVE